MIKQLLFPTIEFDVLRLKMTEEQQRIFDAYTAEEKADFIIKNGSIDIVLQSYRDLLIEFYSAELDKYTLEQGICRECGCTHHDPCCHPEFGACWWENEDQNLCSHCANPEIRDDKRTDRPEEVKEPIF